MKIFAMTLAIGFSIAGMVVAGGPCDPNACTEVQVCGSADNCGHCGCKSHCQKYCRVVCEMKKVKKHVWVVECEEFCTTMPGRRDRCCKGDCNCKGTCNADCGCCEGKKCDPCEPLNKRQYNQPRCGKMRTKKRLVKKEVVCMVPVYKCIMVYCCPKCECNECGAATPPPPAKKDAKQTALPPAPTPTHTTQFAPMPPSLRPM